MRQEISSSHRVDAEGNPAGGRTVGIGIDIDWQDGPLGRGNDRMAPNGAFVEGVIEAAIDRIKFYNEAQDGKFRCRENSLAITDLESAQNWLNRRTEERERRQVEGTHEA